MKYKDPTTGDFKELKIRATDELPVGSIIEYIGLSSNIPAGWEAYGNNQIKKVSETTPITGQVIDGYSESTTDAYSANYVEGLHTYSTSEIRIGTYMDKPLYRKVVEIGSLPNNTTQTYNHNISNMDTLKDYDLIWYDTTDNRFFKAPRIDNLEVFVKCEISTTNIEIIAKGVNWSNRTQNSKVILEYTKTTD